MNTRSLQYRAHGAAGNDPGAFSSRFEQNLTGSETAQHPMRDGVVIANHARQLFLGGFNALLDGNRDFPRFARGKTNHAFVRVANDDQRGKTHILSALDHLGHAIDGDHLIFQL